MKLTCLPCFLAVAVFSILGYCENGSQTTSQNKVIKIAAGSAHSLALKSDGTVWAWGCGGLGRLGNGTTEEKHTPVQVLGLDGTGFLTGAIAITTKSNFSLALKSDGTIWAWGRNEYNRLGTGSRKYYISTPVKVVELTNVISVSAGFEHSLALKSDSTVWAWGSNGSGALGDGTGMFRSLPVQVWGAGEEDFLDDIVDVSAGWFHSLAVKADGTVWSWGKNHYGQLGDGTTKGHYRPVQVVGLSDVISVAAGNGYSLALKSDGTVWAWGWNRNGQLGDGTYYEKGSPIPIQVLGPGGAGYLTDIVAIAVGQHHSLALRSDGTVWAWGCNKYGQLGDGTTKDRHTPVQVIGLNDVIAIAAGYYHSLALKSDGTVWAWGCNRYGQLGDGTTRERHKPVQVKF